MNYQLCSELHGIYYTIYCTVYEDTSYSRYLLAQIKRSDALRKLKVLSIIHDERTVFQLTKIDNLYQIK